ncbi:MAG: nucleoside recognition domain-containing protein, partial [Eubacteriales bacterium]
TNVLRATWERGWSFIKRAGTVIVAASIIIWVLNSLSFEGGFHYITEDNGGASILEFIGTPISYLFIPLGFGNWQAAVATILGLVAKEEVVGTFGSLSSMLAASNPDAAADLLGAMEEGLENLSLIGQEFFGGSGLAGFSFLIFNLLCAPCFAAMGAIKREMNNMKWTWAAIGWMCGFAYAVSLIVYNIGMLINGVFSIWTIAAILVLAVMIYLLVRPNKYKDNILTVNVKS